MCWPAPAAYLPPPPRASRARPARPAPDARPHPQGRGAGLLSLQPADRPDHTGRARVDARPGVVPPDDAFDDPDIMARWVRLAYEAALRVKRPEGKRAG